MDTDGHFLRLLPAQVTASMNVKRTFRWLKDRIVRARMTKVHMWRNPHLEGVMHEVAHAVIVGIILHFVVGDAEEARHTLVALSFN